MEHEFASTQVNLPADLADAVRAYQQTIPAEHLASGGLETEPHATVKFGLHPDVTHDDVARVLRGQPPAGATFGRNAIFPEGKDGVPLYAAVTSPDLHRLNAAVATLPHTSTFPGYTPHVTIAYLRPEFAARYAGQRNPLTDQHATFDAVTFSDTGRNHTDIPLTGGAPMSKELLRAQIAKTDNERQIVFGWASVSVTKDGALLVDRQDDVIYPEDLEDAAYDFVLHSRTGDEMHDNSAKATLIESMVFTAEKMAKMGLAFTDVRKADSNVCLWWAGWRVNDSALWSAVKTGKYSAFSIGGSARRVPIAS